ncbi:MAG: beta-galactosidase [Pseudomonadota bacterium]
MKKKQRLGTCYYPEHWPRDRWEIDAQLMVDAGISLVRIGEFAWSRLEPQAGQLTFEWLDEAFAALEKAGLKIVLGTPTATPPKWLVDKMPDMIAISEDGRPRGFGSRRHYCFSHVGYLEECARITSLLAERYGKHSALEAWQTDNEYGCHDTVLSYSNAARDGFRVWLAKKYANITALNDAWGNVFWSMEYGAFDEVELPNLTVTEPNPAQALDFYRYSSDRVIAFNKVQTDIIRAHSPGRGIGHNFMGSFTDFDHYALSGDLDIATWDSYPIGFLDRDSGSLETKKRYLGVGDPDIQAFHHDLYRTCGDMRAGEGKGAWWVMEQQPGPVNWAPFNPAPEKGALRLWAFEAFAAGAELVSYFRWRQPHFAQEQMHEALLLPNGEKNEGWHVCQQIAAQLETLDAVVEPRRADIALVFDYESAWAWTVQPQGADFAHLETVMRFYRKLRQAGANVDIVPPTAAGVKDRKLVVIPALFSASDDLVAQLADSDVIVVLGPRTGSKTPDFQIHGDLPPGAFKRLIDITVRRVESRPPFAPVECENTALLEGWREFLETGPDVDVLVKSIDGYPAHVTNGRVHYIAGRPGPRMADQIVRRAMRDAGIEPLDLPPDVRIRDNGSVRYVFNYGPEAVYVSEIVGPGEVLMGDAALPPRGVMALRKADT